jgi:hypothetical protein
MEAMATVALMMEAGSTSETSETFTGLHDATSQKTVIKIVIYEMAVCRVSLEERT